LQAKLKIADIAMPVAAAPAGGAVQAAAAAPAEEAAPPAAEKAILTVKLESFEATAKAKIIREVKALLGCNLVEAKTLVEKAPTVLKENVVKDVLPFPICSNDQDAKKVKEAMEKLGAKITLL
jgi:large subunit ribosomal protein L7/L12